MFKCNKEKGLPMSLKVEFRSFIVKYLIMLFLELTTFMKFSASESAGFCYMSKFAMSFCLNSLSFKTEYGRNVLVQSIQYQVPMRVLTHKINVSLFIDIIAHYMNP